MGIDPWGDLAALQVPSMPSQGVYTIDDDVVAAIDSMEHDIAPLALGNGQYQLSVYGNSIRMAEYTFAPYTLSPGRIIDLDKGFTVLNNATFAAESTEIGILMEANTSYYVVCPVSIPSGSKVTLNGRFSAYPRIKYSLNDVESNITLPNYTTAVLLVNGEPVGDPQMGDSVSLDNYELDLTNIGDVSSIGIKVTNTLSSGIMSEGFHTYRGCDSITVGWYVSDNMTVITDGGSSGGVDEETKGLLATIISWLTQIKDGITGVVSAIASLPSLIANAIRDMLHAFFVPSSDALQTLKNNYQTLFETKFGFIYQAYQMLENLWNTLIGSWASHSDYSFQFPEISFTMQGTKYVIVQSQVVSLDNELMSVLRPVAGTFFSFICVLGCVHSLETMAIAIISGKNYFDYLREVPSDDSYDGS